MRFFDFAHGAIVTFPSIDENRYKDPIYILATLERLLPQSYEVRGTDAKKLDACFIAFYLCLHIDVRSLVDVRRAWHPDPEGIRPF